VDLIARHYAHVREVLLVADGVPVVFAHSITAPASLRGAWRALGRLGERPLTATLFGDRRVMRGPLAFRALDERHPLHRRVAELGLELPARLWARRSQFLRHDRPLLVTEVFLPAVLALADARTLQAVPRATPSVHHPPSARTRAAALTAAR